MPSSSELVPWDQEKGQWHRPKGGGGEGEEREEEEVEETERRGRRGATRDSACECSSTLPE